jgi:DNA-binding GntR family transcriptional regulator
MPAKWERLADAIREMIRTGEGLIRREDGLYVPSHKVLLARRWPGIGSVSYGTLRFAIGNLKATGWLENEQGIGLRVREDHPS